MSLDSWMQVEEFEDFDRMYSMEGQRFRDNNRTYETIYIMTDVIEDEEYDDGTQTFSVTFKGEGDMDHIHLCWFGSYQEFMDEFELILSEDV